MTKVDLSGLIDLRREIQRNEERLAELRDTMDGLRAANPDGIPQNRAGSGDAMAVRLERIEELERMLSEQLARAVEERIRLEGFIATVGDPFMRMILTARFVEGRSWAGVAMVVGGGNTPDAVRMACERFLTGAQSEEGPGV